MAIITLTSDLGLKDHYVSSLKGAILCRLPDVSIVDISHQIPIYNLQEAAYILKNAYLHFPKGTVHIIAIKDEQTKSAPPVIVLADGYFFIGADNGIFSLLLDAAPDKILEINMDQTNVSTFPTKDIFAKAACFLAAGGAIQEIAKEKESLVELLPFRATSMEDMIRGTVVYIDSYGDVMTNISESLFKQIGKNREFIIEFASYEIACISKTYSDVPEGEILALFNSSRFLEIAINSGKANELLHLQINHTVTIRFQ